MKPSAVVNPGSMKSLYDNFHFAAAARSTDLLICSGQLGIGSDGRIAEDPAAQFAAAFENVRAVLAEAGLDFDDVIEISTFHVGLREHIATFSRVKDSFLPAPYSAWTAIGVSELAFPGALVEIRATAQLRAPVARIRAVRSTARPRKKTGAKRKATARKKAAPRKRAPARKKRGARKKSSRRS